MDQNVHSLLTFLFMRYDEFWSIILLKDEPMKKDFRLAIEKLDNKILLSINPWYIDSIYANQVWNNIPFQTSRPVVAIVDSGADLNHPLIKNNLWRNPIDNSVGYDFVQNDNDPTGAFYHGTHVAGIVSNVSNKSVDLMILRFMDDNGMGYTGGAASAIDYATLMKNRGVNVVAINCSFGGILSYSIPLADSIKRASDNGINVILAAGNNSSDIDVTPRYPGSFSYSNTITVGAINPDLSLAGYSNYGKNSVTVAAPGTDIVSSLPNNNYGSVSGTSMAAAVVSGEVGLLSTLGRYGAAQIKNAITQGCDYVVGLADKIKYGLINVAKSWGLLKSQSVVSPAPTVTTQQPITPVVNKIVYKLEIINNKVISGWANIPNSSYKPVVQIYVNNVLRYSTVAQSYRSDMKLFNGFRVSMDKKFFNLKNNLLEVKIMKPDGTLLKIAYKGYVSKR